MESKSNLSSGFRSLAGVLAICGLMLFPGMSFSQNVAVTDVDGYNPHTSAMLDVNSTSKGLLLPRVTTAQMNLIASPAAGLMVYNTSVAAIYLYTGSSWTNLLSFGVSALTAPDGSPNNALVVENSGKIGINQPTPSALLHLKGSGATPDDYFRMESNTGGYYGNIFYDSQGMKFRTRNPGSAFYFQEDAGTTNMIIQDNGWVGVGNSSPWGKLEVKGDVSMNADSAIFVVRNRNGYPVFAVYDGGVRVYIDDNNGVSKGGKGGFVVGGRSTAKTAGIAHDIFVLGADSARLYLEDPAKGGKGGFAVGGRSTSKALASNLMDITAKNYFIGLKAGEYISQHPQILTNGTYNSFMGYMAGMSNTTGASNVFIGHQSGVSNTTGTYNTFIGYRAGANNTTGGYNVLMGYTTGEANPDGSSNTFLGYRVGAYMTNGSSNTLVGTFAGLFTGTGSSNVMMGDNSGRQYESGDNNVFIGQSAGFGGSYVPGTICGNNNVFVGRQSGYSATTGGDNVLIGSDAGRLLTTGNFNAFIGYQSGYSNAGSNFNAFIGYQSGFLNNGGDYNAFMGYQAGYNNSTGDWNTFMGHQAGYGNTTGFYNTFIGNLAGNNNSTAGFNTMVGYHSGFNNTTTSEHAFFGYKAGYSNTTGENNTYLGAESGYWVTTGTENTYLGCIAGRQGYGSYNVYVGLGAGYSASGSNNVFLGYKAGWSETGSNKLIIHNSASSSVSEALIYGDFSAGTLRFNANLANIGVGVAPGSSKVYAFDNTTISDVPSVLGVHNVSANYGIGVQGNGGWKGVVGNATTSGTGTRYGVYGYAANGTTNWAGYFDGNVYTTGTYSSSDLNLKKNITNITSAISKLQAIRGVNFEWKTQAEMPILKSYGSSGKNDPMLTVEKPAGKQIGVIAQEVETVVPEAVITDDEGLKSVDYSKLVPLLIEAVKEQQKTIDDMQKRINQLEGNGSRGVPR
jgi:trimeric autotransporter adhesin